MSAPEMSRRESAPVVPRLKIAVLNRVFSNAGGGAESYSIALVEQLAERHDIHVFAQRIRHDWPRVAYHQISEPLRKPRWINQLWFAAATWWATRRGFDVVHSHENTWHGNVQTAHVVPVKYNLFKGQTGWRRALRWLKVVTSPRLLTYLWLERVRYQPRPGRRVVVTSASLQAIMAATYPASASITSIITPGILMPKHEITDAVRQQARSWLGLPPTAHCLLLVGHDYRKKGLPSMLEALHELPDDVVLAVVGNLAQAAAFRTVLQRLGLVDRVFFLGALNDMTPAYQAADCLVHPTLEDTFAMVVLEAMAHGLPVVVSGPMYCGISGLLQHEVNAMILDNPRSVSEISQAVQRVLDNPTLRNGLVERGTQFARLFQWREIAKLQETLYFSVSGQTA